MKRHTSSPDGEDLQWLREIVARLVEQNLAQTATGDHTKDAVEQQVIELLYRPAGLRKLRMGEDSLPAKPPELEKGKEVHQSVPVHTQRAERKRDRVELRMNQHGTNTPGAFG
ncbi:MAG: hypothetical protein AW09_004155 [Candidatus Accumulibacter phosphatis]|uniref:Uncharacterized protein n=1 Tax=Candidatus Accumulibacter phosphatis TaxID=327160 RepID=A0A080LRE8_9PROT|nr:MAG: hypothetical protein AW09_004155 [Candidatus Accumulibacter phosphatis]